MKFKNNYNLICKNNVIGATYEIVKYIQKVMFSKYSAEFVYEV